MKAKKFVSETEIEAVRKQRQDAGIAEPEYDPKTLYERLQERKQEQEIEEKQKYSNKPPRELDRDEVEFLDNLEATAISQQKETEIEENNELESFQRAQKASIVVPVTIPPLKIVVSNEKKQEQQQQQKIASYSPVVVIVEKKKRKETTKEGEPEKKKQKSDSDEKKKEEPSTNSNPLLSSCYSDSDND